MKPEEWHPIPRYSYYILVLFPLMFIIMPIVKIPVRLFAKVRFSLLRNRMEKLFSLGEKAFSEERYDDAMRFFSTIVIDIPPVWQAVVPAFAKSTLYMSSLHRILGNPTEAEKFLNVAMQMIPDESIYTVTWHIFAGDIYADLGRYKEAESKYLKVYIFFENANIKEHEMYKALCYNMATLYTQMGQYDLAEEYLEKSY